MFPFKNSITFDHHSTTPLYLQLSNQLQGLIQSGILGANTKLPGSRTLASVLEIHRQTVIAGYDELIAQGWLLTIPAKGTFVHHQLPMVQQQEFATTAISGYATTAGFALPSNINLERAPSPVLPPNTMRIDEGLPDIRLAPIQELTKAYRNIAHTSYHASLFSYHSIYGNLALREALVHYLNETRGLSITTDHIVITRGSQMGVFLASTLLFKHGGVIAVGTTNYMTADTTFIENGATIVRIPVDTDGLDTNALASYCTQHTIRAVYVTSHHHHPTTVSLSPSRRMHLLQLAQQYHFAIIEDDYDYDFHYSNAPMLPLASHDQHGHVMYIGSFTKLLAPALRVGYMIAPKNVIDEVAKLRRIIDRQGDTLLEQAIARMLREGAIQRHVTKVVKTYKDRRDLFCNLLQQLLGAYLHFEIPKGGMAVWVQLRKPYDWDPIIQKANTLGLDLPEWRRYDNEESGHNGIRLGFASLTTDEITKGLHRLHQAITSCYPSS